MTSNYGMVADIVESRLEWNSLPRDAAYAFAWSCLADLVSRLAREGDFVDGVCQFDAEFCRRLFSEFQPEIEFAEKRFKVRQQDE